MPAATERVESKDNLNYINKLPIKAEKNKNEVDVAAAAFLSRFSIFIF